MLEFSKEQAEPARPRLVVIWRRRAAGGLEAVWTLKRATPS